VVLVDSRRSVFPELGASYEMVDVRTPWLRVLHSRSRGLVTDFGVLNRAMPFLHRLGERSTLTLVLTGAGRFDARERHSYLAAGDLAISEASTGTEAYAGDALAIEWDPDVLGARRSPGLSLERLSSAHVQRIAELTGLLSSERRGPAIVEILDVLRANGLGIERVELGELTPNDDQRRPTQALQNAMSARLAALQELPAIDEIATTLGWDQRRVHRQMTQLRDTYRIVWRHWRELLHQARMLRALQLLTIPSATTELVARLSGFRSPSALCHAFANAGLPSPGRLALIARADALGGLSELAA